MAIHVIFGAMATGKTLHKDRFAAHYGSRRIHDADAQFDRGYVAQDGDLILSHDGVDVLAARYPSAILIPINTARAAIGLGPAPAKGFFS